MLFEKKKKCILPRKLEYSLLMKIAFDQFYEYRLQLYHSQLETEH